MKDVKKGEKLTSENVKSIRPGFGLAPKHYFDVLDKAFKNEVKSGTPLTFDLIDL